VQKVYEIIGYLDKDVVLQKVCDDDGVLFLRGFTHIGKLGDDQRIV
jgi:hypothetical protein